MRTNRYHASGAILALLLILAGAAALRLWRIDTLPPGFHFDESFEGLEAWRILTEPGYKPIFLTGNFGVAPLNSYANAVMFWLFGENIDRDGVGRLVRIGTDEGRRTKPGLKVGVCGEHGGDPASVHFFEERRLDYVSCSPFRVPVARLEAARAVLSGPAS